MDLLSDLSAARLVPVMTPPDPDALAGALAAGGLPVAIATLVVLSSLVMFPTKPTFRQNGAQDMGADRATDR